MLVRRSVLRVFLKSEPGPEGHANFRATMPAPAPVVRVFL